MKRWEFGAIISVSVALAVAVVPAQAQQQESGPVVVQYPSAEQQAAQQQQQAQQQWLAQQQAQQQWLAQQQAMGGNGGVGLYDPGGVGGASRVYGNVQLCGQPPYVYPCAFGPQQANPFGAQQQQEAPPASAARPGETFGLGQPGATFPAQPKYIDQSPSTTSNGVGNEAGPILASPPAVRGTYGGGSYTRSDVMNPSSSFYTGGGAGPDINVRQKQIRNTAYQVGVQAGFAAEAQRINNSLLKYRYSMDQRFDFNKLMEADGAVVPPVITAVTNIVERRSPSYLYLTTGAYEIVQPAFVVAKIPAWQDYLFLDGTAPVPPGGVRAKEKADKVVWAEAARRGWERGVKEARAQFTSGLDRLIRDYKGMRTYHELADMGAVSLTKVAIQRKDGAIYLNGRKAVGQIAKIKLVVQPKFKSKAAVITALDGERAANKAPR